MALLSPTLGHQSDAGVRTPGRDRETSRVFQNLTLPRDRKKMPNTLETYFIRVGDGEVGWGVRV